MTSNIATITRAFFITLLKNVQSSASLLIFQTRLPPQAVLTSQYSLADGCTSIAPSRFPVMTRLYQQSSNPRFEIIPHRRGKPSGEGGILIAREIRHDEGQIIAGLESCDLETFHPRLINIDA